jgi:hypothetical protein
MKKNGFVRIKTDGFKLGHKINPIRMCGGLHIMVNNPSSSSVWGRGASWNIAWNFWGIPDEVKIELYKGGVLNSVISASTVNDGTFIWAIPGGQEIGDDYQIKISRVLDAEIFSFSPIFPIIGGA